MNRFHPSEFFHHVTYIVNRCRVTLSCIVSFSDKSNERQGDRKEEIPLFLLITVPVVAGLICITVIFIFWRRHREVSYIA